MIASFLLALLAASPAALDLGIGLGAGVLDHRFGLSLTPDLAWRSGDDSVRLGAPIYALLVEGEGLRLRTSDWDEIGEFSALLEELTVRRPGWQLRGGRISLSAGHGTVVNNYRAGSHPDHRASGLALQAKSPRLLVDVGLDRVTDPRLFVGELRHRFFAENERSNWLPDIGVGLAFDPAAAGTGVGDGRLVLGVSSPWRVGKTARLGVHLDGVLGLGGTSFRRTRWHARGFADSRFGDWKAGLDAELRGSADGLAPEPFDAHYALYRYDPAYVRPDYAPGLGWRVSATVERRELGWVYLALRRDPGLSGDPVDGLDAALSVQHKARWSSHWSAGYRPGHAGWFALGEGRYVVLPGLTAWLSVRRLRRTLEGASVTAVDALVGLTLATRISSAK
jgi:hypothetical protein